MKHLVDIKFLVAFLSLVCLLLPLKSAYFTSMPASVSQPDGSVLECFVSGDEYHNWLHDKDGYTIIQSPTTGYYTFAVRSGASVVAGDLIAGRDNPAMRGLTPNINISQEAYKELRRTKFQVPETRDAPTIGTINNLVVYIRFSGEAEFGQTISTYDGWFNSSTNSQKNYFLEASYNQLTVNTTFYPAASGGNVVSWQDSHTRGYFQPYSATNTIGYQNDSQRQDREFTLLGAAIAGVASAVPADLVIDSDNDGRVDNVVFIVSGSAGAWSSLLWPHRWAIYDRTVTLRGKRVWDFNLQLQNFLTSSSVGVLCHEFFHTLGAPDLYHYNEEVFTPVGSWDLMESTTNPPQHMGAFMKWKYGDWLPAPTVISTDGSYTLNPVTSSTGCFYRINSPYSSTEYFIVEYRRKTGTFENSIPGSGLLVYRINTNVAEGNADGPPDEVYIYRPGGTTTANGTISSAHFSSNVGRTAINASTNPSPFLTSGAAGGLSLSNIGSAGTTISFNNGVVAPANITWIPTSITKSLAPNATTSQSLGIGNTGGMTLDYTCSLPTTTTTVLDETFATTSLPTNWTQTYVSGTNVPWAFTTGGYSGHPSAAYDGSYNARLFTASYAASVTKLITPSLNLSSSSSASLSFWHTQELWYSDQDELRVYYRTSSTGAWNLLASYTNSIASWTQETIALPNLSSTYYIAFEGTAKYGYGVCLDKVVVTKQSGSPTPWVSLNGGTTVSGSIVSGGATQSITVGFNSSGLTAGTYNSSITIISNSSANSTVSIPVTLNVIEPQIAVSVTSLAYGTVQINTSQNQTFQISNAGSATLSGNITTPAGYAVVLGRGEAENQPAKALWGSQNASEDRNTLAYSVVAGGTNTYTISFAPTAVQAYNGSTTITHNATGSSKTISLTGQGGKPTLGLSATAFSSTRAPGQTENQSLTVSNSGNMLLNYSLTLSGSPSWLRLNGGTTVSSSIGSGAAAHSVSLSFNAAGLSPGDYTATINGTSNDPSNPAFNLSAALTVISPIGISTPAGGEQWPDGSEQAVQFNYAGAGSTVAFHYSTNGGITWNSEGTKNVVQGANSFNWTVPSSGSANCLIRLTDSVSPFHQVLSNVFSIVLVPPSTPPSISAGHNPVSGEIIVTWSPSSGSPSAYDIQFCEDPGFNSGVSVLATVASTQTSYTDTLALTRPKGFYRVIAIRN